MAGCWGGKAHGEEGGGQGPVLLQGRRVANRDPGLVVVTDRAQCFAIGDRAVRGATQPNLERLVLFVHDVADDRYRDRLYPRARRKDETPRSRQIVTPFPCRTVYRHEIDADLPSRCARQADGEDGIEGSCVALGERRIADADLGVLDHRRTDRDTDIVDEEVCVCRLAARLHREAQLVGRAIREGREISLNPYVLLPIRGLVRERAKDLLAIHQEPQSVRSSCRP